MELFDAVTNCIQSKRSFRCTKSKKHPCRASVPSWSSAAEQAETPLLPTQRNQGRTGTKAELPQPWGRGGRDEEEQGQRAPGEGWDRAAAPEEEAGKGEGSRAAAGWDPQPEPTSPARPGPRWQRRAAFRPRFQGSTARSAGRRMGCCSAPVPAGCALKAANGTGRIVRVSECLVWKEVKRAAYLSLQQASVL